MLKAQKTLRKIFFKQKGPIMEAFRGYLRNQSLPLDELRKKQLLKLNALLNHAYHHVPYYHELFERLALVKKNENQVALNSLEELAAIPFLTKAIARHQGKRLQSEDSGERQAYLNSSGGSTGEPMTFLQDRAYGFADTANLLLLKSWRGVGPFDSEIFIWGATRDTFEGKKPLSAHIGDFLRNRIMLNCFLMTESDMKEYIHLLNKHRPAMIRAYADIIYEIARYTKNQKLRIVPQKVIHTGAMTLHDFMRKEIEEVFGCPVFDHYGGREVGSMASECSAHDGLHIMMEHNLLEIVDREGTPCGPGEEGEIVVTNLNNYSMPMIRYKMGDVGIYRKYEECPCGCHYPKLACVVGRAADIFRSSDGATVSPEYFIHLIGVACNDGSIKKFQVIQRDYKVIAVKLETPAPANDMLLKNIRDGIRIVMGDNCTVEFELVDEIPAAPSGKYRYTISEINEAGKK